MARRRTPLSSGRSTSCSSRMAIPTTSTGGRSRRCRAARPSSSRAAWVPRSGAGSGRGRRAPAGERRRDRRSPGRGRPGEALDLARRAARAAARLPARRRSAVYFAGDTGPLPGDASRSRPRGRRAAAGVDVGTASRPGPPRTADGGRVAGVVGRAIAIPIHWGTLYPRRLHRVWTGPLVQPGDRFKAAAARLAQRTDVVVLRPAKEPKCPVIRPFREALNTPRGY